MINNFLPPSMQNGERKPLWKQKGGGFATVLLVGGIITFILLSPKLLFLFQSTLYAILTLCGIGVVLFLLTDKKFRMGLSVGYYILMKKIYGIFVQIAPDKILDRRIEQMENNIAKSERCTGNLGGIKSDIEGKIKTKRKLIKDQADVALVFEKEGDTDRALIAKREMIRQTDLANMYIETLNSVSKWYTTLKKLLDMAKLTVEDAKNEVEAIKERYKIAAMSYNAYKAAMSAMSGDPDENALFQSAIDKMSDDISSKLGEMELVLNETNGIIGKLDVRKEVMSIQGSQLLEKYEKLGLDGILDKFKELPSGKNQPTPIFQTANFAPISTGNSVSNKYFDEN
jgi:phage shock protein A